MKHFLLLTLVIFALSCNSKPSENDFVQKIDSLQLKVQTIHENYNFSFSDLSKNVWEWQKSQAFVKIDSATWVTYFDKPNSLIDYRYGYQTNYIYKFLDLRDNFINIIVLQYIHNDNESYMYLIQFDKNGNRRKVYILASIFKSPDDFEVIHSAVQGNKITTYKNYIDAEIIEKDTTSILW
jgi:hypothetical protein